MKKSYKPNLRSAQKEAVLAAVFFGIFFLGAIGRVFAQQTIPDAVLDIFDNSCAFAGCHAGSNPAKGLDLTDEAAFSFLVNQPSKEFRKIMRVKPGDAENSYLMMKIRGSAAIKGKRMPKKGQPLSRAQIKVIADWIQSLPPSTPKQNPVKKYADAFPGLTLATLQTAQTIDPGLFSYRIAHRFRGQVDDGFAKLFGLDGGAHMYTEFAFPIRENVTVNIGRSGESATFEFGAKWRFLRQTSDGTVPISAAVFAGFDWETRKEIVDPNNPLSGEFLSRTNGERFHWFGQVVLTKQLTKRVSLLVSPGVLLNGNVNLANEDAIVSLGFAGKFMISDGFSVFVEGVPLLSGSSDAATVGGARLDGNDLVINDSFTIGLERNIGGHVFHIYVTNSLGLATSQTMSGGNLDFSNGDMHLGFNIYRALRIPF